MLMARIAGTGSYVPEKVISNHDLERMVETTDDWITTRTGIRERRVSTGESTTEMAVKAGRMALRSAGISPSEIDLVVVGTVTPDLVFPSTACLVQSALSMRGGIPAFDVAAACSGFIYALDVADRYIRSGTSKKALVIGVDVFSRIIDWNDRTTCILFGDGAGAVVVVASNGREGILSSHIHSDGTYWELLYTPGAIRHSPFERGEQRDHYLLMKGNETFKLAVRSMEEAVKEVLQHNGLSPEDISLFIPHQANIRIINAIKERLNLPEEKVFVNIKKYGNTSAGSIPLALDEAVRGGLIGRGDIVVMASFGGGLTWGSTAIRW